MRNDHKWKRMSFKGNKVWVALDEKGGFLTRKGKVLVKYNTHQNYEYWVLADTLKPENQAVPSKKKDKPPGAGNEESPDLPGNCIEIFTTGTSSGNPGPSGIGAVLLFRENRREISECIGRATSDAARLIAVLKALSCLKRKDLPVRVFTNEDGARDILDRKTQPEPDLVSKIRKLMKTFEDISLIGLADRAGIKEIEVAGFLAASAVSRESGAPKETP